MTDARRIACILAALWVSQPAAAQATATCETLRARLATQPTVISNNSDIKRYSSAITKQDFEIRKARQDLQALGCGRGSMVIYDNAGRDTCAELSSALRRMEENKRILTTKRDALQVGRGSGQLRSQLLAELETQGCNTASQRDFIASARPLEGPQRPRSLTRGPDLASTNPDIPPEFALQGSVSAQGQLRTMCVSTCDGSFFPISSNASPLNFRRDAEQCAMMCPGTETQLFYHSLLTQESADMVSASTGLPYRDLPRAFAYLTRAPGEKSACGCNLADYHRRVLEAQRQSRPSPETYSSITEIRGTLTAEDTTGADAAAKEPARPYDPSAHRVRQVGPSFLPSQTSSIDLRNPAAPGPQPLQQ